MSQDIHRGTGLLVIEVRNSNPNGDPDRDSDPRTRSHDSRGVISDVSFKRKLRDLVWNGGELPGWPLSEAVAPEKYLDEYRLGQSPVWTAVAAKMGNLDPMSYQIYVCRGRTYREPANQAEFDEFKRRYWDCRLFGNTVIERGEADAANGGASEEAIDDASAEKAGRRKKGGAAAKTTKAVAGRYVRTGAATFGIAVSAAKVRVQRDTNTVKAGVQEGKDRGMAPLGFRVVEHGVYAMPFTINPTSARNSGCTAADVELMCRLIPYAYAHNASRIRPMVEVRHAWYFEHQDALGSCSDFALFDALAPRKADPNEPSTSWSDYGYDAAAVQAQVAKEFEKRFKHFGDLCEPDFVNQVFRRS
ncbi:MAG: type I CRISPR-associated protein Cas7 [Burkholderiaceae bacterium]